jgi:hypothetical protein
MNPIFRGAFMTPELLQEWYGPLTPEEEARGLEDDMGAFRREEELMMAKNAYDHARAIAKLRVQYEQLEALRRSRLLLLCV